MPKKGETKNSILGMEGCNNEGTPMRVVADRGWNDIDIMFLDEHGYIAQRRQRQHFKRGVVKNPFDKTIYETGYLGVGEKGNMPQVTVDGKETKPYRMWYDMMRRSYDEKLKKEEPTYCGVIVQEEMHNFSYFLENVYEDLIGENNFPENIKLELDKDILSKNNKIYHENNIILVPQELNKLLIKNDANRGGCCIGVSRYKDKENRNNPYRAHCMIMGTSKTKAFPTEQEAFDWYKERKEEEIKRIADEYVSLGWIVKDSRLYIALYNYEVEIDD